MLTSVPADGRKSAHLLFSAASYSKGAYIRQCFKAAQKYLAYIGAGTTGKEIVVMQPPRAQFHWLVRDCTACETRHTSRAEKRKMCR